MLLPQHLTGRVVEQCAGVAGAGADRRRGAARAEVDGGEVVAHLARRRRRGRRCRRGRAARCCCSPQHLTGAVVEQCTACGLPGGSSRWRCGRCRGRRRGGRRPSRPAPSPRSSVSPRPSCPPSLRPQHFTVPLSSRAQVWCVAGAEGGGGAAGAEVDGREGVTHLVPARRPGRSASPRPSWPASLPPQHLTAPSSRIAHAWPTPRVTDRKRDRAGERLVGVGARRGRSGRHEQDRGHQRDHDERARARPDIETRHSSRPTSSAVD